MQTGQINPRNSCVGCLAGCVGLILVFSVYISMHVPDNTTVYSPEDAMKKFYERGTAIAAEIETAEILPTVTPDLPANYKVQLSEKLYQLEQAIKQLGITSAQDIKSSDLDNPGWSVLEIERARELERAYNAIEDIKPPAGFESIHKTIVAAIDGCANSSVDLRWFIWFRSDKDKPGIGNGLKKCTTAINKIKPWTQNEVPPKSDSNITVAPTNTPHLVHGITNDVANLRTGPGTWYGIAGQVNAGESVTIITQNATGDWYRLSNGYWVAAFLIDK